MGGCRLTVGAKTKQQGFAPTAGPIEMVVMKMLDLVGLHLHQRRLGEGVTLA